MKQRKLIETCIIIWLGAHSDEKLEELNNLSSIRLFVDRDACVDYITDLSINEHVYLVVTSTTDELVISVLNNFPQVHSIYLLESPIDSNKFSSHSCPIKVRGVLSHVDRIYEMLKTATNKDEHLTIGFNVTSSISLSDNEKKNNNKQETSFMYAQLFKELLIEMRETPNLTEMTNYCRQQYSNDRRQLAFIDNFERDYTLHSPINWYSQDAFLYRMLNKALRVQDIETLYRMRLFIRDLHQQLVRLYHENFSTSLNRNILILYRGLQMTVIEFEKIRTNIGGLLSINSFMSTSENLQLALIFAGQTQFESNEMVVLFKITIDQTRNYSAGAPFANITTQSHFGDSEQEYLFSLGSVFRIESIEYLSAESEVACVQLKLTDDSDRQLTALTSYLHMRMQLAPRLGAIGTLLTEKGDYDKAREFCTVAIALETDPRSRAICQLYLGRVYNEMGDSRRALVYYQHCLTTAREYLPSDSRYLSPVLNNMAMAFRKIDKLNLALEYVEKAITLEFADSECDQEALSLYFNNMGLILQEKNLFDEALKCYQEALDIQLDCLPSTHWNIARTYFNRGTLYCAKGCYNEGLHEYEQCLKIQQASMPADHYQLGLTLRQITIIHYKQGNWNDALLRCQEALQVFLKCFPLNHFAICSSYIYLAHIYIRQKRYKDAMEMYRTNLQIDEDNCSAVLDSFINMIITLHQDGQYEEDLLQPWQLLEACSKSWGDNYPQTLQLKNVLDRIRNKK